MVQSLKSLLLIITILLVSYSRAYAQDIYKLVTDTTELHDGDEIIIVDFDFSDINNIGYIKDNYDYAMGSYYLASGKGHYKRERVTIVDNTCILNDKITTFKISHPTTARYKRYWLFRDMQENQYLHNTNTNYDLRLSKNKYDTNNFLEINILNKNTGAANITFDKDQKKASKDKNKSLGSARGKYFALYTSTARITRIYKKTDKISINIGATHYATLFYSYVSLKLPTGLEAFTCNIEDGNIKKGITYTPGETIPKETAVILHGDIGTYDLYVANDINNKTDPNNMLRGYDVETFIEGGPDGKYYKLTTYPDNDRKAGFFWGEENGGPYKSASHSAYFFIPASSPLYVDAPAFYNFELFTTGIKHIPQKTKYNTNIIYDLIGRPVKQINQPGIYIINNKKTFIK